MSVDLTTPAQITRRDDACVVVIDGEIGAGKTTLIELVRQGLAAKLGEDRVVIVQEPVDLWKDVGILQEFYEDKTEREAGLVAYDFQTFTFVTRVRETITTVNNHPNAKVFLLERSILTDRFVFMELQRDLVGPRRVQMYDMWWGMWSLIMPFQPSTFVYLKPSLDNCMDRVERRAREGEVVSKEAEDSLPALEDDSTGLDDKPKKKGAAKGGGGVSAAYQCRLREAHEAYLQGMHASEFPHMPARPFAVDDVLVVEGKYADDDFSVAGPARDRVVAHVCDHVLAQPQCQ